MHTLLVLLQVGSLLEGRVTQVTRVRTEAKMAVVDVSAQPISKVVHLPAVVTSMRMFVLMQCHYVLLEI